MKQIILNVPTIVFILLMFGPAILWYFGVEMGSADIFFATRILPTLVGAIWTLSLISYMSSESKSQQHVLISQILAISQVIIHISIPFIKEDSPLFNSLLLLEIFAMLLLIVNAYFLTSIVKKVFYARSTWFLFMEVWIIPIGIMTLTPEIQDWDEGDKT